MKLSTMLASATMACAFSSLPVQATESILTSVTSAENSVLTSTNRLLITSQGAVYEAIRESWGWRKQEVPAYYKNGSKAACVFLGITEMQGRVYTVCTDSAINLFAKKHLFSLDLTVTGATFKEVAEVKDVAIPNGLTDDENGNLYLADHGAPLLPGKIVKITVASPTSATQKNFKSFLACKPNGMKYSAGKLYVSLDAFSEVGLAQIYRYDVTSTDLINGKAIYNSFGFLDDFTLVKDGLIISEFLFGLVSHISESTGKILHQTSFITPTSITVGKSPLLTGGDLIVTERLPGAVYRFSNNWGVQAR